eukprot:1184751-Prorocentrum_minimum.AAC.2
MQKKGSTVHEARATGQLGGPAFELAYEVVMQRACPCGPLPVVVVQQQVLREPGAPLQAEQVLNVLVRREEGGSHYDHPQEVTDRSVVAILVLLLEGRAEVALRVRQPHEEALRGAGWRCQPFTRMGCASDDSMGLFLAGGPLGFVGYGSKMQRGKTWTRGWRRSRGNYTCRSTRLGPVTTYRDHPARGDEGE